MSIFTVTIRFTNRRLDDVAFIMDEITQPLVQYGRWYFELDHEMDQVLVDGKLHWRVNQYTHKETEYDQYACKLVTPLMRYKDLDRLKRVMERLYTNGAVLISLDAIRVHYLGSYSYKMTKKIMRRLLASRLAMTMVFLPELMAPFCLPERITYEDEKYDELRDAVHQSYWAKINDLYAGDQDLLEEALYKLWERRVQVSSDETLSRKRKERLEELHTIMDDGTCSTDA